MACILVIDDEKMLRDLLREVLELAGYEVIEAGDGAAGLEAYRKTRADVVITDIMMPEKDGFETIRDLVEEDPDAKIIALTGFGLHNLPVAHDLGASRIFEKPISPREILSAIEDLLAE